MSSDFQDSQSQVPKAMPSDLVQIATPITQKAGKQYWRSLDELADTKEFRDWVSKEFPGGVEVIDGASRRNVLKIMAASFGLAGLAACRRPMEKVLPSSRGIEDFVPGQAYYYTTVMQHAGEAMGLVVETHDGRPTKIEGNPAHPYSLGACTVHGQAALLSLYDPDRAKHVSRGGNESGWEEFDRFVESEFKSGLGKGEGLRFLSGRILSPSYRALKKSVLSSYPAAKWVEYDAFAPENQLQGTVVAFGQPLTPHYAFDKANVVVSLDSDFLGVDYGTVRPAKLWSRKRKIDTEESEISRLYVAESRHSLTGANADHRFRIRSSDIPGFAADLAAAVEGQAPAGSDKRSKWIAAVAKDLKANQGKSVVVVGHNQAPAVHALVFAINQSLGNIGQTVTFTKPVYDTENSGVAALKTLAGELNGGQAKKLVILGGNPAFTAPYDLHFADAIKKADTSIFVGADPNETWQLVKWAVPEAHFLESWGDAAAPDGTPSIQQPMILPLYGGKSQVEVVAALTGYQDKSGYDIVANYWKKQFGSDADRAWEQALRDGVVANVNEPVVKASLDTAKVRAAAPPQGANGLEVVFYPDYWMYDGTYLNNGWLQELPQPVTKLVWDNAALMSYTTMNRLGLTDGQIVNLKRGSFIVEMPVLMQPGHADESVTVLLGYGREHCGHVGKGVGYNGYPLRTTAAYNVATDLTLEKTDRRETLVSTQTQDSMEGRQTVVEATAEEFRKNPKFVEEIVEAPAPMGLYPQMEWIGEDKGYQWGMSIDLQSCIGCHACTIACQAENNIPIVGKDQVSRGRHMHWIRVDRYYTGSIEEAEAVTQPIPCMQCENAPCENVCPVDATVHSPEGLNEMTYNRCVGTRYCLNNCPYKVRRFNFLNWHREITEVEKMVFNPDVTVRMRGVMEKCTYCVQRIQEGKIRAKVEGHRQNKAPVPIKDGDIQTACQQTCPTDAIVFGNVNDPNTRVSKLKKSERNYQLLAELNTRPRTTYLAKIRNTNPELA
jgi:molybdopterin-containing oxidoreductase family iron-sulfur binding subunit